MPIYTIQTPDGRKLKIEAADGATAMAGAQDWSAKNGKKSAPRNGWGKAADVMANFNRGLLIGDEMAAGVDTAVNFLSGKSASFDKSLAKQRGMEEQGMRDSRTASNLARGTGAAATVAVPGAPMLQGARAANIARGAVAGATEGAAYGLLDAGTLKERVKAARTSAGSGAVVGGALGTIAPAAARATVSAKAGKLTDQEILAAEGVLMTPGQRKGKLARAVEERMTSAPILGDAISDAQERSIESLNRAVHNRALKEIGAELPSDVRPGHEAVRFTQQAFDKAYGDLIPTGGVKIDEPFDSAMQEIAPDLADLTEPAQKQVATILKNRVFNRVEDGGMDGETFKRVESELTAQIGRFSGATDPDQRAVGQILGTVRDELREAAARQNPEFAASKGKIDRGYATLVQAETAASKAGTEGGMFTPKQFEAAIRAGDKSVRKRRMAGGEALNQDLATAAVNVLSNRTPDSGTAERIAQMVGGGAMGAGALNIMLNPATAIPTLGAGAVGAGTLALASLPYRKAAQEAASKALQSKAGSRAQEAAIAELRRMAADNPQVQQLLREVEKQVRRGVIAQGQSSRAASNMLATSPQ